MKPDELKVKFKPRKIDLEPRDLSKLSNLADGEIVEDPLGRHKPGVSFVINHGDLGVAKFPLLMFPAVNPVEFYLFSALQNLEQIRQFEPKVAADSKQINHLLLAEFQFCIFAACALEAFVNQIIPGDYKHIDGAVTTEKSEIEMRWTLEEKIKKVIPRVTGLSVAGDTPLWAAFTTLVNLRNDIVHLKTTYPVSDFRSYQNLYSRLLGNDYEASYRTVQEVIRRIGEAGDKLYAERKDAGDKAGRRWSAKEIFEKGWRLITG